MHEDSDILTFTFRDSAVIYIYGYILIYGHLHQNTEFDGIRMGPPKSESVNGYLYLVPDAKVSYVGSNGLHNRNLRLKLYL